MECTIAIPYEPLTKAYFLRRPNRFILECSLGGATVEAHLADPGRLKELLVPGAAVYLQRARNPKRKTQWSAVLVESEDTLVSLDTTKPNKLVELALRQGSLTELSRWQFTAAEYSMGHSRWDFYARCQDEELFLEVKSVTLKRQGVGLFPDAVTARGRRHVLELAELQRQPKRHAAVLFVAQRSDVRRVQADADIDPKFAQALAAARAAGVMVYARSCRVSLQQIVLGPPIPVDG